MRRRDAERSQVIHALEAQGMKRPGTPLEIPLIRRLVEGKDGMPQAQRPFGGYGHRPADSGQSQRNLGHAGTVGHGNHLRPAEYLFCSRSTFVSDPALVVKKTLAPSASRPTSQG